jgi:hypothetical protein
MTFSHARAVAAAGECMARAALMPVFLAASLRISMDIFTRAIQKMIVDAIPDEGDSLGHKRGPYGGHFELKRHKFQAEH